MEHAFGPGSRADKEGWQIRLVDGVWRISLNAEFPDDPDAERDTWRYVREQADHQDYHRAALAFLEAHQPDEYARVMEATDD